MKTAEIRSYFPTTKIVMTDNTLPKRTKTADQFNSCSINTKQDKTK